MSIFRSASISTKADPNILHHEVTVTTTL